RHIGQDQPPIGEPVPQQLHDPSLRVVERVEREVLRNQPPHASPPASAAAPPPGVAVPSNLLSPARPAAPRPAGASSARGDEHGVVEGERRGDGQSSPPSSSGFGMTPSQYALPESYM